MGKKVAFLDKLPKKIVICYSNNSNNPNNPKKRSYKNAFFSKNDGNPSKPTSLLEDDQPFGLPNLFQTKK